MEVTKDMAVAMEVDLVAVRAEDLDLALKVEVLVATVEVLKMEEVDVARDLVAVMELVLEQVTVEEEPVIAEDPAVVEKAMAVEAIVVVEVEVAGLHSVKR